MPDKNSHLNDDAFWKTLFDKMLPKFKKQQGKLAQKAFVDGVERKAHEPVPCSICTKPFDPFNGFGQPKKEFCASCQQNFDDGLLCFVTLSGEWAFTKFPNADTAHLAQLKGKIFTVDAARMAAIKAAMPNPPPPTDKPTENPANN